MTEPDRSNPKGCAATKQRWHDLAFMAVAGSAILVALIPIYIQPFEWLVNQPSWHISAVAMVLLAGVSWTIRESPSAILGLKYPLQYPPVWLAGTSGAALTLLAIIVVPGLASTAGVVGGQGKLWGWVLACLFGPLLVLTLADSRERASRVLSIHRTARQPLADVDSYAFRSSFERIREWVRDDRALDNSSSDAFDHRAIAQRIAQRLLLPEPPSQAVLGELGSGKSSLAKLVEEALREHGDAGMRVRLVQVSLWPYESPQAAVAGIIGQLINTLGKEVSVVTLRGIPAVYADVISSGGSLLGTLAKLVRSPQSPEQVLQTLNAIASAIDVRLVLWLEDLERFAGSTAADASTDPDQAARLAPIRALARMLDELESVVVVTATTSLDTRFDVEKIAQFVERIPRLDEDHVARILYTVRKHYLARCGIDPASPRARRKLDWLEYENRKLSRLRMDIIERKTIDSALSWLSRTPRTLKQGLGSFVEVFEALRGEIDIDDALVASILRWAAPDAFQVVEAFVPHIRVVDAKARKHHWDVVEGRLKRAEVAGLFDQAVLVMVRFLFDDHPRDRKYKPQGFSHKLPTDYWARYLAAVAPAGGYGDQRVLRDIRDDDDSALLDLLEHNHWGEVVHHFHHRLEPIRVVSLLLPLVRRRCRDGQITVDARPVGLIQLWRIWNRVAEQNRLPETSYDAVRHAVELSVPLRPHIATELEQHFFAEGIGDHSEVPPFFSEEQRSELRRLVRSTVASTYAGTADLLAQNLVGTPSATLLWLCFGIDQVRRGIFDAELFSGWHEVAETILDAAKVSPGVVLPQLAYLVCVEIEVQHGTESRFDEDHTARLFGASQTVLDLYSAYRGDLPNDEVVRRVVRAAQSRTTSELVQ